MSRMLRIIQEAAKEIRLFLRQAQRLEARRKRDVRILHGFDFRLRSVCRRGCAGLSK
jgi:hypothetical protein